LIRKPTEWKKVVAESPLLRDITSGGWLEPGSTKTGYNIYAARALWIKSLRLPQFKYSGYFSSDPSYTQKGESYIGACRLYFHLQ
jgi:hypothetical protein